MSDIQWQPGKQYREIVYETYEGIAKITINRPSRRNAFTPLTVNEMYDAFSVARDDASIGVIILTGANHGGRHEDEAFCSGGDQKICGNGGYVGAGYLAAMVGQKKAREIWYLCRQYTAQEALDMGMVNKVVPFEQLEEETVQWAREMLQFSPTALRFMKASFNAATDGLAGLQQFAGDATLLYYTTDEAKEGRDAFKEKRKPDFSKYPKFP